MDTRIISRKLDLLFGLGTTIAASFDTWTACTANYNAPGDYTYDGPDAPAALPAQFPPRKTVFLKTSVDIPKGTPLENLYFSFSFQNMEGMLRLNGDVFCGIDANHSRIQVPRCGKLDLVLEFNSVPNALFEPEMACYGKGEFRWAGLVRVDRAVENLCHDVWFAWQTAEAIDDERRKALLLAAVEEALLAIDLQAPPKELSLACTKAAVAFQARILAIAPDGESGSICAVGHTHIDTAWLWPLKETVRKCSRTFSTACRYMSLYPDYRFSCSQAQLYAYTKDHYPDLFKEIKKWVATGRWENTGAMWVEPDCNVPDGESLIRQIMYGLKFYRDEFGTRPVLCWLPDVFGYPASLPEILLACGLKYFSTNKLHWQAKEPFPYHLFNWKGLDGSTVLAHIAKLPNFYNGFMDPDQLHDAWQNFAQKADYPEMLFSFGYGDGGGGVTETMMARLQRAKMHFPGLPAVRISTVEDYFGKLENAHPELPVWDGELYLQTHRGTYTTHSDVKRANRLNEMRLRKAEMLDAWASLESGRYRPASLSDAWKTLLVNQFHDILPGSSITEIYPKSMKDHEMVSAQAEAASRAALNVLAPKGKATGSSLRLFNTLSWERMDPFIAEITCEGTGNAVEITDQDGNTATAQLISRNGKKAVICASGISIPACGYTDVTIGKCFQTAKSALMKASLRQLENEWLSVSLDKQGRIVSLYDKNANRDILPAGAFAGELQLFQDGPEDEDAWNIHDTATKHRYDFAPNPEIALVENGPVRSVLRIRRTRRQSTFEQDVILYAGARRLDFAMRINWNERNTVLKIAFPVNVRTTRSTCEVQFGAVERATHQNSGWDKAKFEIPCQRWMDLSETGYGAALLNDSRYGCDIHEQTLRLTLLRGTIHPDPVADIGYHECACSFVPHEDCWNQAEIANRGWEFNTPVFGVPGGDGSSRTFLQLDGYDGTILQAFKRAEDGNGFVLRFYEANGGRGTVQAILLFNFSTVIECNAIEEPDTEIPVTLTDYGFSFSIVPYQIRTFRVIL